MTVGDPACYLDAVCLSCGRFIEGEVPESAACPHCAEPVDGSRPLVTVRRAVPADAEAVGALTESAYRNDGHLEDDEEYAAMLRDAAGRIAGAVVLVAEIGGKVVASATLAAYGTVLAETARPGEIEVRMLAVDGAARRRGVARALMAATTEYARSEGVQRVVLCTQTTMTEAHRLYESLGYERQPERDWSEGPFALLSYGLDVR